MGVGAGTATKLVLNILTTLGLGVGCGKVASNLMIDMKPTNDKLKDRAVRILVELLSTGGGGSAVGAEECRKSLEESGWVIADARERLLQQ